MQLKLARVSADLTDSGRLFQAVGPATEKETYRVTRQVVNDFDFKFKPVINSNQQ